MKIVIAPDSFKGTNTAIRVASRIEAGILRVFPDAQIHKIPIADGGEGTVDAMLLGSGGKKYQKVVTGPLGEQLTAEYGILDSGVAVIEMAAASGLPLVPKQKRDPRITTTYGTGELISAALDQGCRRIMLGIGGSATNDGGTGVMSALGVRFLDVAGKEVPRGGGFLDQIAKIDISGIDPRLKETEIVVACDVTNPLLGEKGASAIYGPQKGADPAMVKELDQKLAHLADVLTQTFGEDNRDLAGAGAAGGLPMCLLPMTNSALRSGIDTVLDVAGIDELLGDTDLVITGEGRMDHQSVNGKVPAGVAKRVKKYNIPVLAIVGDIGAGFETIYTAGVDGVMSTVNRAMPLEEALSRSGELLEDAAERVMRIIRIGMQMK